MKKLFISIFILSLLLCGALYLAKLFGVFSYMIPASVSSSLSVVANGQEHKLEDEQLVDSAIKAINYSIPVKKNVEQLSRLTKISLNIDGELREYTVYKDEKNNFYLEYLYDIVRVIDKNSFAKVFSSDLFAEIYSEALPPALNITINNSTTPVENISGSWKYNRFDGKTYTVEYNKTEKTATFNKGPHDEMHFDFSSQPDLVDVEVLQNGKIVDQFALEQINTYKPKLDGIYTYKLYAQWKAKNNNANGRICYTFNVKYDIDPSFTISSKVVRLGEEFVIYARNIADISSVQAVSSYPYKPVFYPYKDEFVALFPISYMTTVGSYSLELTAGDYTQKFNFDVVDREFETQNLTVDNATLNDTVNSAVANSEYNAAVAQIESSSEPAWYCDGEFIEPVQNYELTTPFGVKRYVNGSKKASRHPGIDMAVDAGTPVKAANSGKIVYAGFLQMTGNTVVIDHGFGLKTWYLHMNSLNVKKGDMVKKGAKIGEVGSTGYSTGPHLHFEATVNGTSTNPWTLFKQNPLQEQKPAPEQSASSSGSKSSSSTDKASSSKTDSKSSSPSKPSSKSSSSSK